jgi:D-beta-D-heptose 7-phosphate kinase/D-beta-D-heptose 1-phosphate adenosyltransferase
MNTATTSLAALVNGFATVRVLVLGDLMLDRFVYGSVERISPEAPIPVLSVDAGIDMPGGAANVARNVAALGAHALLAGVVGDDEFAADLRRQLDAVATIESHLTVDASRPTSVKTRYVADGQQIMRADRESRAPLAPEVEARLLAALAAALEAADVIVLSDYAKGVLSESVTRASIAMARTLGKTIIVDPKSKDFTRYRGATILTPNRLELQQATGMSCASSEEVAAAARVCLAAGICEVMVITRGKDGMSVIAADAPAVHLATSARQVFDVSGAGDTVVAALALALACGGSVAQAAGLANVAAGIVVGKRGTATVTIDEILANLPEAGATEDPRKIFSLESALRLAQRWREGGMKIAFANGCFDLLHPGHISLLDQARGSADRLVVGLNSDASIRRLKGPTRPVQTEAARATVLAAVKSVDAVVIFDEDTPIKLIEVLAPDVLVKGADYRIDQVVGADLVMRRGGKVLLAELLDGHSTTETVKRVAGSGTP